MDHMELSAQCPRSGSPYGGEIGKAQCGLVMIVGLGFRASCELLSIFAFFRDS